MSTELTDTAAENRPIEAACPVVESMEQIGSKWRLLVLHDLQDGEKRFNELKRSTGGTHAHCRECSRISAKWGT